MSIVYVSDRFGISFADVTTGDYFVTEVDSSRKLMDELYKFTPREVICNEALLMSDVELDDLKERLNLVMYPLESWYFDDELCKNTLLEHFHVKSLEGLGVVDFGCGVIAAGALLRYLTETQKTVPGSYNETAALCIRQLYDYRQLQPEESGTGRDPAGEAETRFPSLGTG